MTTTMTTTPAYIDSLNLWAQNLVGNTVKLLVKRIHGIDAKNNDIQVIKNLRSINPNNTIKNLVKSCQVDSQTKQLITNGVAVMVSNFYEEIFATEKQALDFINSKITGETFNSLHDFDNVQQCTYDIWWNKF